MQLPAIFLNFKTYEAGTGKNAVSLAKCAEAAANETGKAVCLVVQAVDIRAIVEAVSLPVYAQHADPITHGSNTGKILPEALKEAGASGTVLNHAENKQSDEFVEKATARAQEAGLEVLLCAESAERAKLLAALGPGLIACEQPELIGNPDISISTANPGLITASVEAVKQASPTTEVIAGAGVHSAQDVRVAVELGAKGAFVAAYVMKAKDHKAAILDLLDGFNP